MNTRKATQPVSSTMSFIEAIEAFHIFYPYSYYAIWGVGGIKTFHTCFPGGISPEN